MTIDLGRILRLAEAATPGPWRHYHAKLRPHLSTVKIHEIQIARGRNEGQPIVSWPGFDGLDLFKYEVTANCEYIAAVSPAVMSALIAWLRPKLLEHDLAEVGLCMQQRREEP